MGKPHKTYILIKSTSQPGGEKSSSGKGTVWREINDLILSKLKARVTENDIKIKASTMICKSSVHSLKFVAITVDPWTTRGSEAPWPSMQVKIQVEFIMGLQHKGGFPVSTDSTNRRSCSSVVSTVEKKSTSKWTHVVQGSTSYVLNSPGPLQVVLRNSALSFKLILKPKLLKVVFKFLGF